MHFADLIYEKTGLNLDMTSLSDSPEGQALVAALLAMVAKSDNDISPAETMRMIELLQDRFHLAERDAIDLVSRAANGFGSDAKLDGVISNINEELGLAEKEELLSMVMHVIAADEHKNNMEMDLLATLVQGLKVPDSILEKAYARYFQDKKNAPES